MKHLLISTAIATLAATSAVGDAPKTSAEIGIFEASDLLGKRLYSGAANAAQDDWNDIGEIDDLLVTLDGDVPSAIVGVGGFLGIGEKDVSVAIDQIRQVTGDEGMTFLVVDLSAEELEAMPSYKRMDYIADNTETEMGQTEHLEQTEAALENDADAIETGLGSIAAAGAETLNETAAEAETGIETAAAQGDAALDNVEVTASNLTDETVLEANEAQNLVAADTQDGTNPLQERDGYMARDLADLEASRLQGLTVYSADDEDVGEISALIIGENGNIERFIVDVGGFLGMGEKPVELSAAELSFMQDADGDELRAYTQQTEDTLEDMPEYEG